MPVKNMFPRWILKNLNSIRYWQQHRRRDLGALHTAHSCSLGNTGKLCCFTNFRRRKIQTLSSTTSIFQCETRFYLWLHQPRQLNQMNSISRISILVILKYWTNPDEWNGFTSNQYKRSQLTFFYWLPFNLCRWFHMRKATRIHENKSINRD